jgi:hypothetical protein
MMVYYGDEKSGASKAFPATVVSITPPPVNPPGPGVGVGIPPKPTVATCNGADFNHDHKVGSVDFSILLSFWKTVWPFRNPCVDINKDKKVNSIDFSTLMYQWGTKR